MHDDLDALVELNTALFAEDSGQRDPFLDQGWPQCEGQAYFAGALDDDQAVVFVAADEHERVGYLIGRLQAASSMRPLTTGDLESMYVRPPHRNSGAGTRLVEAFVHWADARQAGRIAVAAYAANEGAIRFYQRFGLRPKSVVLDMPRS